MRKTNLTTRLSYGKPRCVLAIVFLAGIQSSHPAEPIEVQINNGNIFVQVGQEKRQLTYSGRDDEPVLSPDGKWIAYTRQGEPKETGSDEDCRTGAQADELRRVFIDGTRDELLMRSETGPERHQNVCRFRNKQFTTDGEVLFFLTPAWVTSDALHSYNLADGSHRYVMAANGVIVLDRCADPEYRDNLVVNQHRYFVLGGSYDWWWLFDRTGRREIQAIGDLEEAEVLSGLEELLCRPR